MAALAMYRGLYVYHAQHAFGAYTLHDRAGTLASHIYKAEKPSVCPSAFDVSRFSRQPARHANGMGVWAVVLQECS